MSVAGTYDCTIKSPMGDQASKFTVNVDGDTLTWKMNMTVPMPMTLDCDATVDGDTLTGNVKAGAFGTFPLTGTRAG